MKKILLVSGSFPPISGGASLRMWRFCKSLMNDLKIEVLTINRPSLNYIKDDSLLKPIKNLIIHRVNISKLSRLWGSLPFLRSIYPINYLPNLISLIILGKSILTKSKFDFIFGVYPTSTSLLASFILSKIAKIPLVLDMHDLFFDVIKYRLKVPFQKRFYLRLEKTILSQAFFISIVTKEFKDIYAQRYKIPQKKLTIIPNNVDLDEFKLVKVHQKPDFVISYLGILADYHEEGIYLLIRALNKLKNERKNFKIKFQLVGPLRAQVKEKISKIDKYEVTERIGFVNKSKANFIMKNSDILYLILTPTHKFALEMRSTNPSKLFEYIGCGKPILAYLPKGSTQKLIDENELGYVLTKYSVENLANIVSELYTNKDLRDKFSKNALRLAKKFDSKVVYKKFLDEILSRLGE